MIRHQKEERTRFPEFNTESWKTNKDIEEIYSLLGEEDSNFTFPYELEMHKSGQEAVFRSVSGDHQINAHEYEEEWKNTEVDFIYFGKLDEEINSEIDRYKQKI